MASHTPSPSPATPRSHSAGPSTPHSPRTHSKRPSSQIYVLSADGSKLFLLDPSAPEQGEDPPAYHTISSPSSGPTPLVLPLNDDAGSVIGVRDEPEAGPSSPRSVRIQELPSIRSSASLMIPPSPSAGRGEGSHRAYTASSEPTGRIRAASAGTEGGGRQARMRRAESTTTADLGSGEVAGEGTPLLAADPVGRGGRGMIRSILCGEVEQGDESRTWGAGWRRYWRPLGRAIYWRCVLHLLLLNFPFALLIWPFLFAGTVAGTALLITLPIGAAVWWLTLILARTAARLEIMMQTHHHAPLAAPVYHPIFHRLVDNPPSTPHGSPRRLLDEGSGEEDEVVWETGFIKCSYAMFCDYYSYSALSYFVLLKPLITLFSSIIILVLGAVALGTLAGIPVYLRSLRRWGKWQARFAIENL